MKKLFFILGLLITWQSYKANAQEATIVQQGDNCGTNCSWSVDSEGKLTIWATDSTAPGTMKNFDKGWNVYTGAPWKNYREDVTSVEIVGGSEEGLGITNIAKESFYGMKNILTITIGDSVTTWGALPFGNQLGPTSLTCNAENLEKFIVGALFRENATINCTGGDCRQALENGLKSKFPSSWENIYNGITIISASSEANLMQQNADGSYTIKDAEGNIIGYKGKRIYTIEEANAVAGPVNRVSIRYR